jgi:hypothetical protein
VQRLGSLLSGSPGRETARLLWNTAVSNLRGVPLPTAGLTYLYYVFGATTLATASVFSFGYVSLSAYRTVLSSRAAISKIRSLFAAVANKGLRGYIHFHVDIGKAFWWGVLYTRFTAYTSIRNWYYFQ